MTLRKFAFRFGVIPLGILMIAALASVTSQSTAAGNRVATPPLLVSAAKRPLALRAGPAANTTTPAIKPYFNGFENNLIGWCSFAAPPAQPPCDGTPGGGNFGTVVRVHSANSLAPYGTGINASSGNHYASVNGTGISAAGCPTYPASDESCTGPFTTWNNPQGNFDTFKPFRTAVDVYLDTSWANSNPGNEFEWDTALNARNGTFLQDYIFTVESFDSSGSQPGCTSSTSPGFVVGYSANTNNDPGSGSGSLGSFTPACITTTGWYRFEHRFFQFNAGGDLGVEMAVLSEPSGSVVADFVADTGKSLTAACAAAPASCNTAGGPLYGWFPNQNIPGLPIDNIRLTTP